MSREKKAPTEEQLNKAAAYWTDMILHDAANGTSTEEEVESLVRRILRHEPETVDDMADRYDRSCVNGKYEFDPDVNDEDEEDEEDE